MLMRRKLELFKIFSLLKYVGTCVTGRGFEFKPHD